jgi:transcriptional regulator with XRE-family HTH domain
LSDRSQKISRLLEERGYRTDYVRAKLAILVPSQIRALRGNWTQQELANAAEMKQSRISAIETPGAVNFNLETLVRLAAALEVGLKVEFVPYSEMLTWEESFSQDAFNVTRLREDKGFIDPASEQPALKTAVNFSSPHIFNPASPATSISGEKNESISQPTGESPSVRGTRPAESEWKRLSAGLGGSSNRSMPIPKTPGSRELLHEGGDRI